MKRHKLKSTILQLARLSLVPTVNSNFESWLLSLDSSSVPFGDAKPLIIRAEKVPESWVIDWFAQVVCVHTIAQLQIPQLLLHCLLFSLLHIVYTNDVLSPLGFCLTFKPFCSVNIQKNSFKVYSFGKWKLGISPWKHIKVQNVNLILSLLWILISKHEVYVCQVSTYN